MADAEPRSRGFVDARCGGIGLIAGHDPGRRVERAGSIEQPPGIDFAFTCPPMRRDQDYVGAAVAGD